MMVASPHSGFATPPRLRPFPANGFCTPDSHLVWLDGSRLDPQLVGGKGASLSRLAGLGAPVPAAFALTTCAYADFAAVHNLPIRASEISEGDLPKLRQSIMQAPLPDVVGAALARGFDAFHLTHGTALSLAVRSSGTAEDSAAFSFAGLHDTVLNVRTMTELEIAVRQCWASLWSDRAVRYRLDGGLSDDTSEIAVVVQRLVRSDISFVAFTADPVTQDPDRLVISASWGLGESIVSGQVVPDHIAVGPDESIAYDIGSKQVMVIPGHDHHGGTREVAVPRAMQSLPALESCDVLRIASLARKLSDTLGYPADIEGGLANGSLYLFQIRPITTLQETVPIAHS